MIGNSLKNKIVEIALKAIDDTIGKKFPLVDKLTDLFQEQEKQIEKIKELERKYDALVDVLKDKN